MMYHACCSEKETLTCYNVATTSSDKMKDELVSKDDMIVVYGILMMLVLFTLRRLEILHQMLSDSNHRVQEVTEETSIKFKSIQQQLEKMNELELLNVLTVSLNRVAMDTTALVNWSERFEYIELDRVVDVVVDPNENDGNEENVEEQDNPQAAETVN